VHLMALLREFPLDFVMAVALNKTRMISYQIVKKCVNMSIHSGTISALDGQMGRSAIEYGTLHAFYADTI